MDQLEQFQAAVSRAVAIGMKYSEYAGSLDDAPDDPRVQAFIDGLNPLCQAIEDLFLPPIPGPNPPGVEGLQDNGLSGNGVSSNQTE